MAQVDRAWDAGGMSCVRYEQGIWDMKKPVEAECRQVGQVGNVA